MGEILSQKEIDELLNQLTTGAAPDMIAVPKTGADVKRYEFDIPQKFNKEHLRTLEIIFDNFARMVSSFLTGYLRTSSHLEVKNAEQVKYRDFSASLGNPVIMGIMEFAPLKGAVLLELSSNVGYSIIDRVLGGPGQSLKKTRDFSEIEKILLERILNQIINYIPEPWENVVSLRPKLDKIETNPQFVQVLSPTEMVALVVLSIKIGSSEGFLNFCIPHLVIEPVMDRLNTKFWFAQPEQEEKNEYRLQLEERLEKTDVPVTAVVGRTNITVNDFINLQIGDIIPLDSFINSDLDIMIGNLLKFHGKPGTRRGRNAIQITSLVEKEE